MDIKFNKFDKKTSLDQQRELFIECFPETTDSPTVSKGHYLWKFHSFPHTPTSYEYEARIDKDIIAYYAAIPYSYNFFKEQITVGMVCDVMTGIKARGKGVFTKLGVYSTDQLKAQDLAFTTGYPIRKEVIPGHLKAGWEVIFEMPLYIRFLKFNTLLKSKKLGILTPILNFCLIIYNAILSLIRIATPNKYELDIYSEKEIDIINGLDEFLKEWQKQVPISLKKDPDFLKWRLGGPQTNYHITVIKKDQKISGLSISRKIVKDGIPSLGVLDFMVLNEDRIVINALHKSLKNLALDNNIEAVLCMTSNFIKKKYKFHSNGFLKSPFKFFLIIKKFDDKINSELMKDPKNWHSMWIDSDDL